MLFCINHASFSQFHQEMPEIERTRPADVDHFWSSPTRHSYDLGKEYLCKLLSKYDLALNLKSLRQTFNSRILLNSVVISGLNFCPNPFFYTLLLKFDCLEHNSLQTQRICTR